MVHVVVLAGDDHGPVDPGFAAVGVDVPVEGALVPDVVVAAAVLVPDFPEGPDGGVLDAFGEGVVDEALPVADDGDGDVGAVVVLDGVGLEVDGRCGSSRLRGGDVGLVTAVNCEYIAVDTTHGHWDDSSCGARVGADGRIVRANAA